MVYFSKAVFEKRRKQKILQRSLIFGGIMFVVPFIVVYTFNDSDFDAVVRNFPLTLVISGGLGIVFFLINFLARSYMTKDKLELVEKQERLLNIDFDAEMQRNHVPIDVKKWQNDEWFLDVSITANYSKELMIYHRNFLRSFDDGEVKYITGNGYFIDLDGLEEWFNGTESTLTIPERSVLMPYAPFVIGQHEGRDAFYYETAGFKIDVFEGMEYDGEPLDGTALDWEILAEAYVEIMVPELKEKIELDSEDAIFEGVGTGVDKFWVYADDLATLEEFAKGFRDMCDDDEQIRYLLSRADEFEE